MRNRKGGVMKYYEARFIHDRNIISSEASLESINEFLSPIADDSPVLDEIEYYKTYFSFMALSIIEAQKFLLKQVPHFMKYSQYRYDDRENFLIMRTGRIMMITETLPRAMSAEKQAKYFENVCDLVVMLYRSWTPPDGHDGNIILFEDDVENREKEEQEFSESLLVQHPDMPPPGYGKTDIHGINMMRETSEYLRKQRYEWKDYQQLLRTIGVIDDKPINGETHA